MWFPGLFITQCYEVIACLLSIYSLFPRSYFYFKVCVHIHMCKHPCMGVKYTQRAASGSDLREFGAVGKGLTSESMEYSEEGGIKPVALCGNKHHCSNRVPRMSEEGL